MLPTGPEITSKALLVIKGKIKCVNLLYIMVFLEVPENLKLLV
jgi:hypothetical protein